MTDTSTFPGRQARMRQLLADQNARIAELKGQLKERERIVMELRHILREMMLRGNVKPADRATVEAG